MSFSDHPLLDVFSETDLERLRQGKCVESNAAADCRVARMLTDRYDDPESYVVSLAAWFSQAARHGCGVKKDYRSRLRSAVRGRSGFHQVCGELMAAYFLERQLSYDLEYVLRQAAQGTRTPEFRVKRDGIDLVVEVKTVVGGIPSDCGYTGAFPSPVPVLRRAMKGGTGQLDKNAKNLFLIADWWMPRVSRDFAIDALYGDSLSQVLTGPSGPVSGWREVRRNAFCQMAKNTRFGVVGLLRWASCAECLGHLIHNGYATNRIPSCAFDPWPQFVLDEAESRMVWRNLPGQ